MNGLERSRVLYVQYTNPAVYPPLLHSTAILAEAGCEIRILGLDTMRCELALPYANGVTTRLLRAEAPGWRQKAGYARFVWAALREAAMFRPDWVYASDPLSTPAAELIARRGSARLVYHEHDTPVEAWRPESASWFMRRVMTARLTVARQADVCIIPNAARADAFRAATGRRDVTIVWNCPRRGEAAQPADRPTRRRMRVLFSGSIVPGRLPLSVVDALALLPPEIHLVVAGYETLGSHGYIRAILDHARLRGVDTRVQYEGVLNRDQLFELVSACDVGLALLPNAAADPNEAHMVGASNKVFEYLARGVPVLIGGRAEWREAFESAGVAQSCDRDSADSIAAALRRFFDDPVERRAMGERGRRRVLTEWNYETQFEPVLRILTGESTSRRDRAVG